MNTATSPAQSPLKTSHYKECVEKRGLDTQWVLANCRSVEANEATQYLGYTAQSDGIWLEGCNHQSQFKPDKPWKKEGDKKAPKYRSQTGEYDAMLPTHPTDPYYWDDIEALKERAYKVDGHPCLVVTEGFFKAIAGCSNDLPTIALLGVEMGLTSKSADLQSKRYLVPTLERYAKAGLGFIIALDADCATNKDVIWAQRKLAHQLKPFKVPIYSATGLWSVEQGKGIDDFIQANGGETFKREVISKAMNIEAWEKQFQVPETPTTDKLPPADLVGRQIIEDHRNQMLWSDQHKSWMSYGLDREGVWTAVSDFCVESFVDKILESRGIVGYGSASYVTNIVAKMRRQLLEREWKERSTNEILPFTDGVLNLATGQFHLHAPGHRLTWSLPRPYNMVDTSWQKIESWLAETTGGNRQSQEILLCFAAAVLRGRADLHKFLHLTGVGGTGKSTFTRLLEALIGSENCWNGSLQDLEDKHEVARLMGKRLVILPDQEKMTGSLSNFKRLTGQDSLSGRQLYKDGLNFRFQGMAVVTSNAPIFHADGGSWLTRRVLMLAFDHKPATNKVRDLESEFERELSALTNHLLSISNNEISRVLRRIGKDGVSPTLWQSKIRTDSIAAWVNERVNYDPIAKTQIGGDRKEWAEQSYNPELSTLFGSYSHYCQISGLQSKGKNNFSADLIELCQQTLGWSDIQWARDGHGRRVIRGLKLRIEGDLAPFLEEILTTDDLSDDPSDDLSDDLNPCDSRISDDSDNLLSLKSSGKNNKLTTDQNVDPLTAKFFSNPVVSFSAPQVEQETEVVREVVREVVKEVVREPLEASTAPKSPQVTVRIGELVDYSGVVARIAGWEKGAKRVYLEIAGRILPNSVSVKALKPSSSKQERL